jgi:5-methylcytosine-specific restriction endonuclease McrA
MVRTRRALKRAKSIRRMRQKESVFSIIVKRQNNICFYCGEYMGTDCTKEHLLSRKLGGTDTWPEGNIKGSHSACNLVVGHLEVHIKLRLREICLNEGRDEMFRIARQLRRAQAREAFIGGMSYRKG